MKMKKQHNHEGFTLLELLLSMAITTIIVVMVFGIFRVSIRAWERGERDTEQKQSLRTVTGMVSKQLRSITIPASSKLRNGDRRIDFIGDEQHMTFFSKLALDPNNGVLPVLAKYTVALSESGASLFFSERALSDIREPVDALAYQSDQRFEMLSGMESITFEYLVHGAEGSGGEWLGQFETTEESPIPAAVAIRIVDPHYEAPVVSILPLYFEKTI